MTIEMTMLVYCVVLTFIIIMIPACMAIMANGLAVMAGPRDNLPEPSPMAARANRLRINMLENMALFVPLILVANAAGIATASTVLGAQLFFFGRIAHGLFYLVGWPWVRTGAYAVSLVGMILVALALF